MIRKTNRFRTWKTKEESREDMTTQRKWTKGGSD